MLYQTRFFINSDRILQNDNYEQENKTLIQN